MINVIMSVFLVCKSVSSGVKLVWDENSFPSSNIVVLKFVSNVSIGFVSIGCELTIVFMSCCSVSIATKEVFCSILLSNVNGRFYASCFHILIADLRNRHLCISFDGTSALHI